MSEPNGRPSAPTDQADQGDPADTADPTSILASRSYLGLLALSSIVGVIVSLGAWCFLELVYQTQREVFHHLRARSDMATAPRCGGRCRCWRSPA